MTDSPAPLIEDLFCQGHPLDHVVTVGLEVGWTRDDVMAVLREQGWDLDASGRLPRSKRITLPRGLRVRPPAASTRVIRCPHDPPCPGGCPPQLPEWERDLTSADFDPAAYAAKHLPEPLTAPSPSPEPVPAPPEPETAAAPAAPKGRQPKPTEHGTHRGLAGHKRNQEPIPEDDSCGCLKAKRDQQAAYQRDSYARKHPKATSSEPAPTPSALPRKPAVPPLPPIAHGTPAGVQQHHDRGALPVCDACRAAAAVLDVRPTAAEIRAQVDEMAPRINDDGSINARFVAIESTLRGRHGHPSYIAELDGPGKFRPQPEPEPEQLGDGAVAVAAGSIVAGPPDGPNVQISAEKITWGDGSTSRIGPHGIEHTRPDGSTISIGEEPPGPSRMPCTVEPVFDDYVLPADEYERIRDRAQIRWPAPEQMPAEPLEIAPYRPTDGVRDLDDWLGEASRSESPAVREAAEIALDLAEELHDALDELVRAEHAHHRGNPE